MAILKVFSNPAVQSVFDAHNCTFAEFKQLLVDTANGTQSVSKADANEKIREIFSEICGIDAESKRSDIRKAVRRHKIDIFEVIEEVLPQLLQSGWQTNPFFDQFVDYRNLNEGDTNVFYTPDNTILNVSRVSNGNWDLKRQRLGRGQRFAVTPEPYAVAVYAEFERLMAGVEDWATLVSKVAEAFQAKINGAIYTATANAYQQLPASSQFVKTLDFSAVDTARNTLNTLVEDVQTASGLSVAILGVRSALAKLRKLDDINWISNQMKQELYETGRLGYWMGVPLVEIPQVFAANTTNRVIDPTGTNLMVMPISNDNKFIKFVNEGDAMIREVNDGIDNQDMTSEYMYIQKLGIATVIGYLFGNVTLQNA